MFFKVKKYYSNILKAFFICLGLYYLPSCSPSQKGIISKGYHNTTARFNAYFYALEGMSAVEEKLRLAKKDDYNDFLPIYPAIDSVLSKSVEEEINEVIKKASIAIQRHPNSNWSDDSYLLVGKSRYYLLDFPNAVETFKYVNVNSEDPNIRHTALIHLMLTYITLDEPYNVVAVNDVIKKEKLNEDNTILYHLTLSHLYQIKLDAPKLIENLEIAAALSTRKEHRDRLHFILGQYLQAEDRFPEAYEAYRTTLKSNPSYELSFHTKLNMGQVTEISETTRLKEIRKYFKKLLRDKKNLEYHDKIFYEIGKFEERQEHYPKAITDYEKSVRKAEKNPLQKAYSFLKIAKIYHDIYKDLNRAKNYYDSLITYLPKEHLEYPNLKREQEILTAFTKEQNIIREQDSLLTLSEMDTALIRQRIDKVLLTEDMAEKAKEKNRRRASRFQTIEAFDGNFSNSNNPSTTNLTGITASGEWYFYDLSAVANGKNTFKSKWGNRPPVDHWNRKSATWERTDLEVEKVPQEALKSEKKKTQLPQELNKARFTKYYANIPFSAEAKKTVIKALEEAHFNLAKVYLHDLMDTTNAIETFSTLTSRFLTAEKRPETLYQLYLLYNLNNSPKLDKVKNELLTVYPNSLYAKLILNPNFRLEDDQKNEQLKLAYEDAYEFYEIDSLKNASHILDSALIVHPELPYSDKLRILKILIQGKSEGLFPYQASLQDFIKNRTESEMKPYAEKLLEASNDYKNEVERAKGIRFIADFNVEHCMAIFYPTVPELVTSIPEFMVDFLKKNTTETELETATLSYDNDKTVYLLDGFKNKKEAMAFYTKLLDKDSPINKTNRYEISVYATNKDNFQILYDQKAIKEYEAFFKENYLSK